METEETLPFPPPFTRLLSLQNRQVASLAQRSSAPSLEQLTEARLAELANRGCLWQTPPPRSAEVVLASEQTEQQLVLASHEPQPTLPLRWRGQAVSEQLQLYALRVARGEVLAPYRGPILANGSLEPWAAAEVRTRRKSTRRGARPLLLLAALATLAAFVLPNLETGLPELEPLIPVTSALAQPAAATPAATELVSPHSQPLPQGEPSPQAEPLRGPEPLEPPGASPRAVTAPGLPSVGLPSTRSPALPLEAQARAAEPGAQHPAPGAPSSDSAGSSMLLLDEPSF